MIICHLWYRVAPIFTIDISWWIFCDVKIWVFGFKKSAHETANLAALNRCACTFVLAVVNAWQQWRLLSWSCCFGQCWHRPSCCLVSSFLMFLACLCLYLLLLLLAISSSNFTATRKAVVTSSSVHPSTPHTGRGTYWMQAPLLGSHPLSQAATQCRYVIPRSFFTTTIK